LKRIVSVSLGSSTRNHRVEVEFLGEKVTIERIGTDGNLSKAIEMIENLDGKVDAFGMGGIDLYLIAGKKRYVIKDATKMARAARKSPIVDGSGLKNTLERKVVHFLSDNLNINLKSKKILMASAVDRFGMAEAFSSVGADIIFGDFIFALGIPMPIKTLRGLEIIAGSLLPVLTRMPFHLLYPTGSKQEHDTPKYTRYYEKAEIIAGDFLFLKKYMPPKITGKIIVTNTVTSADIEELKKREAALLVTSTPEFSGRSFGTNVMEALIVSFSGKRPEDLSEDDYLQLLEKMKFEPRVVKLS